MKPPITTKQYTDVLLRAYRAPFRHKSNFARKHNLSVLIMGQLGYISTFDPHTREFGTVWYITSRGLSQLVREGLLDPFDYE